jgi:autotransporter-associated beta strand protein
LNVASLVSNGGDLHFDLFTPLTNADAIHVAGPVSFNAASTVTVAGNPVSGTYVLLDSTGPITYGVLPTLVNPSGTNTRPSSFTPDTTTNPDQYRVVIVSGAQSMNWTGTDATNPTNWDINTSSNWTSTDQKFFNLDNVTFGNGPTNRTINIVGAVSPGSVTVNNSVGNDYTFAGTGTITGLASLTKTGGGKLTIGSPQTYSGGTTVNGGTLELTDNGVPGTGPLVVNSVLSLNYTGQVTFGIPVSGSGVLQKTGAGTAVLTANNTHTGGTSISAGTVLLNNVSALGSGTVTLNGGALANNVASNPTLPNNIVVSGSSAGGISTNANSNLTLTGALYGNGSLQLGNAGNNATVYLGFSSNNMTGGTISFANNTNAVRFTTTTSGSPNVAFVFNNTGANRDTLDFAEGTIQFGSITGAGIIQGNNATNGPGGTNIKTIETGALGFNDTFSGVITNGAGIVALRKVGTGTLTLTGNDNYTGGTNVAGGTLVMGTKIPNGPVSLTGGRLTVATKGTANSAAGTSVVPSLAISAGASVDLTNNSMVIDYTGAPGTLVSDVRGHLRNGRLLTTAASPANTRLGYVDNNTLATPKTSFGGISVDATSVLVKFTYSGDSDLDGDADGVDIGNWAVNFTGELGGGPTATLTWSQGDWDYDGDADGVDAGLWATAFTGELGGAGLGSVVVNDPTINPAAAAILQGMVITVVPEPATLGLLGLCVAGGLARRSRRTRN